MADDTLHPSDDITTAASRAGDLREAWQEVRAWMRTDGAAIWLLVGILLVAAYLRLSHVNWDMGTHIHPDERFLTMVSDAMKLPKSLGEFFDSTKSPMSPYNKGYNFFVYGTLPLFIVRVVAEVANTINKVAQLWTVSPGVPVYLIGYDGVHFVGRALSGIFDLGCVFLAFVIGRRLYSRKVGLLAAALYAFAVLPLQQSHFYTVDTFGTFFAMLTFYFAVRVAQGGEAKWADGGWANYLALGASLGASLACRINLAPLAGIAVLAAGIRLWDDWHALDHRLPTADGRQADGGQRLAVGGRWLATLIQATLFRLFLMGVVTIVVFRLAQPYAFGGTTLLDFSLAQKFRDNMAQISQLISGNADYPPGHQWTDRTPFVFPLVNMVVWGLGIPLGITAWAGWALAALQVLLGLTRVDKLTRGHGDTVTRGHGDTVTRGHGDTVTQSTVTRSPGHPVTLSPDHPVTRSPGHPVTRSPSHPVTVSPPAWRAHLLPVAWIGGMFLWQGLQFVQSMRYLLPIYPLLAIMAAWVLWRLVGVANRQIGKSANEQTSESAPSEVAIRPSVDSPARPLSHSRWGSSLAYFLIALVTIFTMLWGWGFLAIYRRPLSRITASRWIYANVPPGKVIANEHWDDGLPMRLEGKDGFGNWGYKGLASSSDGSMQMYWEDTAEKRELLYKWLNEADYLVLSSNRLWGSIPRLPMRYPMSTLYYQLLFEEKLGFKQVGHFTSFPTIFGIEFNDTGAEEAFSVYDHPEVYVFEKTPEYSEALARSYFDPIDLEHTLQMWPKQVSAAPTALRFTPEEAAQQQAGGTWRDIFDLDGLLNRWPALSVLAWLILIELLGVIAFPLAFVVMRGLSDRGYGLSKTLGILLLAWLSWIGPSLKIVPYERWWIALALLALVGVSALILWRRKDALRDFVRERRSLLLTEEAVFLAFFALFLLIRIANPDLWHPARGGEKPMDFAYLNAVIKSTFFPPYDPWQAGGFMNYYYFGFVIVGTLVKLIGIVPWVAYNLIVPTLFALTGLGAFAVVYSLVEGDTVTEGHGDTVTSGQGDMVTQDSDPMSPDHPITLSPSLPVTLSPGHPVSVSALLGGLAGAFFVAIIGNFGTVKLLIDQFAARGAVQTPSSLPGLSKLIRALDGVIAWLGGKQPLNFPNDWWFWNPSRVIPDTINEFPFFTFTYADLHAHMIALPLTLLALALAVALVRNAEGRGQKAEPLVSESVHQPDAEHSPWRIPWRELWLIALLGLVVGALRATNTWDFPTYLLVSLAAVVVIEAARRMALPFPLALDERLGFLFRSTVAVGWRLILLVAVGSIAFNPYTKHYATAYAGLQPWQEKTTALPDYLTVWGFFLVLAVIYLLSEWGLQARERQMPRWLDSLLPVVVAVAVVLMGAGWLFKLHVWLIAVPLLTLAVLLALARDIPGVRRLALLLLALALAITMGVEVVRQKDDIGRMNTVFKFYMQAWVLFGVSAAFGLASWAERAREWSPGVRRLAWGVTVVLFVGVMLFPITAAQAKVRDRFSAEASPRGLDGMAYLDKAKYADNNRDLVLVDDKAAILWMLENVDGSPVVLEATTPGYRWGSRYSIYTGLPTVQGWDWHQKQQRSVVPGAEIDRRVMNVREIYDTSDLARAQKLLDHYNVSYIVVGPLEQAYYNAQGLTKFDRLVQQGYLEQVYTNKSVKLYRVVGRTAAVTSPAPSGLGPRPVPTPTGAAAPFSSPLPGPS
jgi:YYY domain-containing protein